jgi:hypothetical protein
VGRHAAPAKAGETTSLGRELVAWGAFAVPLSVGALVLLGTEWLLALAIGALGAAAFALVWLATQMHTPQTPDPDGDGEGPA